jgi:hypothetical protein
MITADIEHQVDDLCLAVILYPGRSIVRISREDEVLGAWAISTMRVGEWLRELIACAEERLDDN